MALGAFCNTINMAMCDGVFHGGPLLGGVST